MCTVKSRNIILVETESVFFRGWQGELMIVADMHIHSKFSRDASSTMEEYCLEAIVRGVSTICFTDHVDYNSAVLNLGKIEDLRGFNFNTDEYFNEINRLKKRYKTLEILSGIEFSEPHLFLEIFNRYCELPFDYILGSIHHCYNSVFPAIANLSEEQAIYEYYDLMIETIYKCKIQTIAHIDFPRRYFNDWKVEKDIIDRILKLIIEKDIALEINTSSVSNACKDPMPYFCVINRYVELGGIKAVLGSDSHNINDLAKGFKSVMEYIPKGLKIGYFKNREFIATN